MLQEVWFATCQMLSEFPPSTRLCMKGQKPGARPLLDFPASRGMSGLTSDKCLRIRRNETLPSECGGSGLLSPVCLCGSRGSVRAKTAQGQAARRAPGVILHNSNTVTAALALTGGQVLP